MKFFRKNGGLQPANGRRSGFLVIMSTNSILIGLKHIILNRPQAYNTNKPDLNTSLTLYSLKQNNSIKTIKKFRINGGPQPANRRRSGFLVIISINPILIDLNHTILGRPDLNKLVTLYSLKQNNLIKLTTTIVHSLNNLNTRRTQKIGLITNLIPMIKHPATAQSCSGIRRTRVRTTILPTNNVQSIISVTFAQTADTQQMHLETALAGQNQMLILHTHSALVQANIRMIHAHLPCTIQNGH